MNENLLIENNEDEMQAQPKLQLITGGKEPPSDNWLKDLAEGTVFLTTLANQTSIDAQEWHVVMHYDEYTKLLSNTNNEIKMWVNNLSFSRQMKLVKILGNGKVN
jgi:hypothetical protein